MVSDNAELGYADEEDVRHIIRNLRAADREEIQALHGPNINVGSRVMQSFVISRDTTFVGKIGGEPICVFGVKAPSLLSDIARPWMLGTEGVPYNSRAFAKYSKKIVASWAEVFPRMENYVYQENVDAVRWLQWLGFNIYYPKPFGAQQLPFHRFEMRSFDV